MPESKTVYDRHYSKMVEGLHKICTAYQISAAELLFASSFIINFVFGKLLHVFSESDEVYNYYNDKGNFFNQIFVKRGWGWSTVVLLAFLALQFWKDLQSRPGAATKLTGSRVVAIILRWGLATLWWLFFTQWCFGLPIMDKFFVHTGGKCASIPEQSVAAFVTNRHGTHSLFSRIEDFYESRSITSYKCRKLKGSWEGGHDPSGHVFLLVHSSLFLFHEIKPFWEGWTVTCDNIRSIFQNPSLSPFSKLTQTLRATPSVVAIGLIALWWFMLLVTNMYFHSLAEKLVGLVFGFMGIAAVYYAPRWRR